MKIKTPESLVFCSTSEIAHSRTFSTKNNTSAIKLFQIELSAYHSVTDDLTSILTPAEIIRANKYRHINDRNRFIISRSILKYLLAKETNRDVVHIQFDTTSNHKPFLPFDPTLHFNVSHAGNYALIAIGNRELGVDVEYIDHHFDYTEILPNVFSAAETQYILNSDNQKHTFFSFWTRKEALVKAIGKGIDDTLKQLPITNGVHHVKSTLVGNFKTLTVIGFHLNRDYVGALAFTEVIKNINNIAFYPLPSAPLLKRLCQKYN